MSVAGIFGSSLFANAISQVAQKLSPPASPNAGAQSAFAALHQGLLGATSNSSAGGTSVAGQLAQIGQDLKSGNLAAAQADFTAFKIAISQHRTQTSPNGSASSGGSGPSSGAFNPSNLLSSGADPLAAAMLAYGSLQQGSGALNASMLPIAGAFSINA